MQEGLFAAFEVCVDARHAGDRCQYRLFGDEIAGGDVGARGAPRDRCANLRVVEVELGHPHRGLRALDVGLRGARAGIELVDLLPGRGLLIEQRSGADEFGSREFESRGAGGELRLRACQFGGERARVDAEQQLALAHARSVDEVHFVDRAGDTRAQFDEVDRLQPAAELLLIVDAALNRGRHAHRWRWRRTALRIGRLAAAAERELGDDGSADESRSPKLRARVPRGLRFR